MRRSALVVLSVLAVSCSALRASPAPSDLASMPPSSAPSADGSPTWNPTPSQGVTPPPPTPSAPPPSSPHQATPAPPSPSASSPTAAVTLDPSVIRSIPLADGTPGQLGPRLAGISGDGNDVVVTDLATGSVTSVSAHVRGHQEVLSVELSGNHLVWATGAWASYEPGVAPCSVGGAVSWTVWARDLEAGTDAEIAMGKNTDTESCAAYFPDIAVDGDLLAYAVEDHERASKEATTLVIRSLVTGEIVRTVDTDLYIEDLAISDEDVAFIDGHLSTDPYSDIESPRLIVSTTDSPALRLIETGQYVDSLSFVNGRLAWLGDEADDEEVWTADVKDLKPVA